MKTKLFLSNSEIADSEFLNFCESKNIELVAKSLISFNPVAFGAIPVTEVVFFASPRSVDFFIDSVKDKNYAFACLGSGTAKSLEKSGFSVDFIGSNAGQPAEVLNEFLEWLGKRKVIFPLSSKSNRSISAHIPSDQCVELIVYETVFSGSKLDSFDTYVFTSPSNVDSFLEMNAIPNAANVISWGTTTETRLLKKGITPSFVLRKSNLRELEEFLSR